MTKEKYLADTSVGAIIFKKVKNNFYFAVIFRKLFNDFRPPAGHPWKNEDLAVTAQREALEETGFKTKPIAYFASTHYSFLGKLQNEKGKQRFLVGAKVLKTIHWFLLEYESGHKSLNDRLTDKVLWLSFDKEIGRLTYADDRKIAKKAFRLIQKINKTKTNSL